MNGYFVTGTDTGVGKTYVAAALVRHVRAHGKKVLGFKPIETGCGAELLGPDQKVLRDAAGGWQTGPLAGVYRLRDPIAPFVAARDEGLTIDIDHIVSLARRADADFTVVEGAGGWRVPITDSADISTLAGRLAMPVVIVARAGLGTINHTLLTIEAVERDGCSVAAIVLSRRPEEDRAFAFQNAAEIGRRWDGGVVVFDTDPTVLDCLL
ncbi:MAG: dethiobiotin synthase [Acidobacteriota bacterium]